MSCRLCFIAGEFPPLRGGLGDYTRELGIALARRGHQVHVITRQLPPSPATEPPSVPELQVHPKVAGWNWRALFHLKHILQTVRPHIVHLQYQTAAYGMHPAINTLPWWVRRWLPHARTVLTYHDLRVPYLFPKAGPVRRWVTLLPARLAHGIIVTNPEDEAILQKAGLHPTCIPIGANVHPHAVPAEEVMRWRQQWDIPPDARVIGYFGFLNRSKGVTNLIEALAQLVATGYNVHLFMLGEPVGTSDPTNQVYRAEVEALIQRLNLGQRVHWTGFLPDEVLSCGFAACEVVVLPYRDGVSLRRGTLQAALVHGAAVVTTEPRVAVPALTETGALVLVPPGDSSALARAIQRLLDDETMRRELQRRARRLAELFSWERIARQHEDLYARLWQSPAHGSAP